MEWPPYSPYLSGMDFGILGIIKTQVHVKNADRTILTQFFIKKNMEPVITLIWASIAERNRRLAPNEI